MRLFGLMFVDPCTESMDRFQVRRAERLEEYLVTLLVDTCRDREGDNAELFDLLLSEVVLRHVYDVKPRSVRVVCYDGTIDAVVLVDSAPSRRKIPTFKGYVCGGERVYELETADRYVVPMGRIVKQLTAACTEDRWSLMECDDLPPCLSLAQLSKPSEPLEPLEPTEPTEPTELLEQTTEPTKPTEPTEPADASRPSKKRALESKSESESE